MNIFHTNIDPYVSARSLCDKHCNKMLTETVQMICTSHQLNGTADSRTWKAGYIHHPMTKWVSLTQGNYLWSLEHAYGLRDEYYRRYGFKPHKSIQMLEALPKYNNLPKGGMTSPPQCMPDEYKDLDHTIAYKRYYIHEKLPEDWCVWNKGVDAPEWIQDALLSQV